MVMIVAGTIEQLIQAGGFVEYFFICLTIIAVFILRVTHANKPRIFHVSYYTLFSDHMYRYSSTGLHFTRLYINSLGPVVCIHAHTLFFYIADHSGYMFCVK